MMKKDSNIKNNLKRLAVFLSVALLSAFLLMAAINMLNLPNAGAGGGGDGSKRSSEGNNKTPEGSSDIEDYNSQNEDWQDRAQKRREEKKATPTPGKEYAFGETPKEVNPNEVNPKEGNPSEGSEGQGELQTPADIPNIDISGDQGIPNIPFGSGESGQTIVVGNEKQPHTPMFEVLGYPNYPFLKVMVMENYSNNHWTAKEEKPEVKINFDKELDENYSINSVKIKPIVPSNGYLPVLSGNIDFKYRTSVNWLKNSGTFYVDELISDSYEMDYELPIDYDGLRFSNTDDSYDYNFTVPNDMETIVNDIIKSCNSDFDVIKSVENYLTGNYRLEAGVINSYGNSDGIEAFLRNKGGSGNTLDFLSAYTFLLQVAGIPCRLAVGYKIDPELKYQIVYKEQAYIYPEIKFEKYGWVPMEVFGYDPSFTPPNDTLTAITSASSEAKRGTSFTVKGTAKDINGAALNNMSVLIYVKQAKEDSTLSYVKAAVNNGYFEVTCDIKYNTDAGKYQVVADLLENDLYRTSTSDPEMKVVTDTLIERNVKASAFGSSFKLEGRLLDNYSKEGVNNQNLFLELPGSVDLGSTTSDEEGKFSKVIKLKELGKLSPKKDFFFVKSYNIAYKMNFKGTEIFFPSSTDSSIYVWQILWFRVVLTLLVLVSMAVLFYMFIVRNGRMKKQEDGDLVLAFDGSSQKIAVPLTSSAGKNAHVTQISIEFPQIKNGYLDVWGVNDELIVRFEDSFQNADEIKNIFYKKGIYSIVLSDRSIKLAKREISIVDYREEVISNGKNLIKELSQSINVNNKMTLREILVLTRPKLTNMKYMILEQIFSIMEKAVYSLNDITRDDYELLYMCIQKYKITK